jgi:hypothetical protein
VSDLCGSQIRNPKVCGELAKLLVINSRYH